MSGVVNDIVSGITSTVQTAADRFGDSITPGFDPIIGNPFTGDKPIITPTGNWSDNTWQDLSRNGLTDNASGIWHIGNSIADKIAMTIAGNYAGGQLGALGDSAGFGSTGAESGFNDFLANDAFTGGGTGWSDMAGVNPDTYAYTLGDYAFTPDQLPFNPNGIDIGAENGWNNFLANDASSVNSGLSNSINAAAQDTTTGLNNAYSPDSTSMGAQEGWNDFLKNDSNLGNNSLSGSSPSMDTGGGIGSYQASGAPSYNTNLESPGAGGGVNWSTTGGNTGEGLDAGTGNGISGGLKYSPKTGTVGSYGTTPSIGMGEGSGSTMFDSGPSLWDQISGAFTGNNGLKNTLKGISSINSAYNNYQSSQRLKALQDAQMQKQNYYNGLIQQSYDNPNAIYNSSPYQSLQDIFMRDLRAKDAANGRNSQYGARATAQQNYFNTYLDNYRKTLQNSAQQSNTMQGMGNAGLTTGTNSAYKNVSDALMAGLGSIFG